MTERIRSRNKDDKSKPIKAVVLAGGLGTRLRPFTLLLPKPMLAVGNKPIMEHIIDWLKANGINDVVIATGYLGRTIEAYFGDGKDFGVNIEYARSDRPLGHAGQLKSAEGLLTETFVCLYGDAILEFDLKEVIKFHQKKDPLITMTLMRHETQTKYGVIETDSDGRLSEWKEKPVLAGDINVGCYVVQKKFLDYIPPGKVYGMKEAFESAIQDKKLVCALKVKGTFTDIGDKRAYKEADQAYIERYGKIP
ncbi:MAG: nucleotidyltransferase family protein [Thaumarchaeota archaeon]|nr:nucleotidyltransferase family protein [Nitrososphaerota archaeon]